LKRASSAFALICLLAFSAELAAQQYVFRAYRQADGLRNLSITGLATDRSGFLWVATENGAYRFLGSGFRRYGLEDGLAGVDVRDIMADPQGTVWVGTEEDLFRWDGLGFVRAGSKPISIVGPRCIAAEDEHHLLVVDHGRLYRMEHDAEGRMISYLPAIQASISSSRPDLDRIASISVVRNALGDGEVWIGSGNHLYSLTKTKDESATDGRYGFITEWGTARGIPVDEWQSVVRDPKGTIWAAGLKHVVVMQPGADSFIDRSIPGIDHQSIFGHAPLVEDPQGRMLAPAGSEIARWNGDKWQFVGGANGLTRVNTLVGMVFNGTGDLFVASRGNGLHLWAGYADWESWSSEQTLPATSIWAIVPPHGNRAYLGTENGPAWIDIRNGGSGRLPLAGKWGSGRVAAMGDNADGTLWAATYAGIFLRFDPKTNRTEPITTLPTRILTGFEGASGRLFLFTTHGVYFRRAGDVNAVPQRVPGADAVLGESSAVQSAQSGCESPDGTVWLVGNNRIVRFKAGIWTAPAISGLRKLNGTLLGISCSADGTVWVTGDQTGTWRLTQENDGLRAWRLGLPQEWNSLSCLTIFLDRRGWLWLGTELGILVWNGHEWRHLSEETGLIWNDTNQGVIREDSDGSLWIGTSGGVSHLLRPERVFDPVPISVSLTQSQRGSENLSGVQKIVMKEEGPPLRFQLSSPLVRNRSELTLKLRMIGMTQDWVDTKDGFAAFTRLSPGSYTFVGKACNPGINACSAEVAVAIKVLPPWWNTNWFYLSSCLVISILILAGVELYARHLRERSRELEQLVRERTRELEESRELLRVQATHDGLTGMLNRVAILNVVDEEIERARRGSKSLVLALVDLDHFKRVNDSRGHLAGDEALREFAAAIHRAVRPYDHCGRYGGEEFLIILPDMPPEAVEHRLGVLHDSISNLAVGSGEHEFRITCSIGAVIAQQAADPMIVEPLLATADRALYEAKATGRNRVIMRRLDGAACVSVDSLFSLPPDADSGSH
jgi:diguanylate cyclase (GGDEF)-like protein